MYDEVYTKRRAKSNDRFNKTYYLLARLIRSISELGGLLKVETDINMLDTVVSETPLPSLPLTQMMCVLIAICSKIC